MRRTALLLLLGACSSAPTAPEPEQFEVARLTLGRPAPVAPAEVPVAPAVQLPPPIDEMRGLLGTNRTELESRAAASSPVIRTARARVEAARSGIAQSTDLRQLLELYRAFVADANHRPTAMVAPSPNVDALSAEMARLSVGIAAEDLRRTIRTVVADARRAHADAAQLGATRAILDEDIALQRSLVAVLQARFESGVASQAGLLAFRARLESLITERAVLDDRAAALRARWNRLLDRPENAAVDLSVEFATTPGDPAGDVVALALLERQEHRRAGLMAQRAAVALRLAETMTLPRYDVGSSRLEHAPDGRFPEPGRGAMPRWTFGVRESQVEEMRARERAAKEALAASGRRTAELARFASSALQTARRRVEVSRRELVPLAEQSFQAIRGAYEGNRTGYIELLDGARALLRARLGLVEARKNLAHAEAALLEAVGVHATEGE